MMNKMNQLLKEIRSCTICQDHLPLGPNPIVTCHPKSKVIIIGQAPGHIVHESSKPWSDKSGKRLREWLGVSEESFYNTENFAIVPMGFCYPGKGKTGDLPPRKECAPQWHNKLLTEVKGDPLFLLIGKYAQDYYLPEVKKLNLTTKVMQFPEYLPQFFVLPHPSPLNNRWMAKNPWFEKENIPVLRAEIRKRGVS